MEPQRSAFTTPHGTKRARPSPSSSSWCSSSSEQKIPRPRNAFIIFRQAHSQQVMRQLRDTNGQASTGQVSAVIGKLWRDASAETRKEFFDRANEEKRVHAIMYSGYKYQPKRKEVGKGRNASQGGGSKKRVTRASKRLGVEKEGAEEKVEETETEESEIGENQDRFSDSNCDDPTWRS
ncbi:HMG-box [Piedraia hortae CBS 480.64]|uniref:HMG-box n=1 Tax=Piedraia hortae CBS 480.64 TaxID=1314780 RepID=A0A6A7C7X7_9PEZI|nr:HMG-box [Piedraia hortae CBS 480.64]